MLQSDAEPAINVVVCVHDALPDVRACLNALAATEYPAGSLSITVVDDGSSQATAACLRDFCRDGRARLIRHDEAHGYTAAANAGIRVRGEADYVVLLNSDTIVPSAWLHRLLVPFTEVPDIGLAGPVSNAASWQSIPEIRSPEGGWAVNPLPPGWTVERMDSLIHGLAQAEHHFPRVPVLNGFCLMVRAELFDRLGPLDEENFPRGYGEENDLCFRAADAGYGLVVATNCYVFHAKSKSFGGEERNRLAHAGKERLAAKYNQGRLERASATMRQQPMLAELRARVGVLLPGGKSEPIARSAAVRVSSNPGARRSTAKRASDADAHSHRAIDAALKELIDNGATGVHELGGNVYVDVLEPGSNKQHRHIRGSLPDGYAFEEGFQSGPVLAIGSADVVTDVESGVTLVDGSALRGTTVTNRLAHQYRRPAEAEAVRFEGLGVPIASQRMGNYCRWWLDSVSKPFLAARSQLPQALGISPDHTIFAPSSQTPFQRQARDLLAEHFTVDHQEHALLRGPSINSPGLCYAGGQRVGALVREFSDFLATLSISPDTNVGPAPLIYLSRSDSRLRSVVNEDDLLPVLRDLGFAIVTPAQLPLAEQIAVMRQARLVVAPHGAGLTNILFCRPGTTVVEIFPEGGVHGSAFVRIANHLGFDYYFTVAEKVGDVPKDNPNNTDMRIDIEGLAGFLKEVMADLPAIGGRQS